MRSISKTLVARMSYNFILLQVLMSFGMSPATIKRGEQIRAKSINNLQLLHQPTTNTVPSRFQDLLKQNKPMVTVQKPQTNYLQNYKAKPEEQKMKHRGLKRHGQSIGEGFIFDGELGCHQPQLLEKIQKGTSPHSDRNQPKIQQSDSILVYYLKRIVDNKDILANQIYDYADSEYLDPIIRMTNIVKVIEKINYEKLDVTNIIKTAYLTEQGRQMLLQYSYLKYRCLGEQFLNGQQQRTPEKFKMSINKSGQQLKDLQKIIQNKKREEKYLQNMIGEYNIYMRRTQVRLGHYKFEIARTKKTNQDLQNLIDTLRKESKKEQQSKEEIIKQRIKQQTQYKGISLLKDSIKKECQKYEQLRDKAKKEWLQYQTLSDSLSEQCNQLKMKIEIIKKIIDCDGVKLAENPSLAQELKYKETLCDQLHKQNEQLKEKIGKDEKFVKSGDAQLDALSQDARNKEKQIVELKKQLECKTQEISEIKADAVKLTTGKDHIIYNLTEENRKLTQNLDALKQVKTHLQKVKKQLILDLIKMYQKQSEQLEKVKHLQEVQEENAFLRELNQKLSKQVNQLNVSGSIIRDMEQYKNQQGVKASSSMILRSVVSNPDLHEMEEEQQLPQIISIERNTFDEVGDLLEVEQKQSSEMGCKKCQVLERKIKNMVQQLLDPESIE